MAMPRITPADAPHSAPPVPLSTSRMSTERALPTESVSNSRRLFTPMRRHESKNTADTLRQISALAVRGSCARSRSSKP